MKKNKKNKFEPVGYKTEWHKIDELSEFLDPYKEFKNKMKKQIRGKK